MGIECKSKLSELSAGVEAMRGRTFKWSGSIVGVLAYRVKTAWPAYKMRLEHLLLTFFLFTDSITLSIFLDRTSPFDVVFLLDISIKFEPI